MTMPTVTVEVAFSTDPLDTSPTWTDISAYVSSGTTKVGKSNELDAFDTGTCNLTLDNSDRRFDPLYTSGPYYGSLLPRRRLRVQAAYGGTTYDVFHGFVDRWPVKYSQFAGGALVDVSASDAFILLGNITSFDTPWDNSVADSGGTLNAWYRLDETAGPTAKDSSGNDHDAHYWSYDAKDTTTDSLLPIPGAACQVKKIGDTTAPMVLLPAAATLPTGHDQTIAAWVNLKGSNGVMLYSQGVSPNVWLSSIYGSTFIEITPTIIYVGTPAGGSNGYRIWAHPTQTFSDGKAHLINVYFWNTSGSTVYVYAHVDGVRLVEDTTLSSGDAYADVTFDTQSDGYLAKNLSGDPSAIIDEVLIWVTTVGNPQPSVKWYTDNYRGLGDDTGTRIGRLLDAASWPSSWRSINDGTTELDVWDTSQSQTILDRCATVERSEQGAFYVDHSTGDITFRGRAGILLDSRSASSQATYSDDSAETLHYSNPLLTYDDQLVVNRVTVNWDGGSVISEDSSSQSTYGIRELTVDTVIATHAEAQGLADWYIARYKDVFVRFLGITLDAGATNGSDQDAMFAEVLGRTIGDRVTVECTPMGVGSQLSEEVLVNGIAHDFAPDRWLTIFTLSAAETRQSFFQLDVSQLDGSDVLMY